MKTEKLAEKLDTTIHSPEDPVGFYGLTEAQALKALERYGPNALTEKKGLPWYINLLLSVSGLFNYLMWAGSILCLVSYGI